MTRFIEKAEREAAVAMLNSAWATVLEEVGDRDVPWAVPPFFACEQHPASNPFGRKAVFAPEPTPGCHWERKHYLDLSFADSPSSALEIARSSYDIMKELMERNANE